MRPIRFILAAAMTLTFAVSVVTAADKTTAAKKTAFTPWDMTDLDPSVSACANFNQYANGGWLKKNPIPPAYSNWGVGNILNESNREQLRTILGNAAKSNARMGSNEQKIGDFYTSCMDEKAIEEQGLKPLQPELARIAAIKDPAELQAEIFRLHSMGLSPLFNSGSQQDRKNSEQVIFGVGQGGLGLPDRDYYLKDDPKSKEIREKYAQYVQKVFELAGDSPELATAKAKSVIDFETKLASASLTRVERRDPDKTYHRMTLQQASELAPNINWAQYLSTLKVPAATPINVAMPDYFKEVDKDLSAVPLDDWKSYLRFNLINGASPSLSSPFVNANFDFFGKTLRGTKELLPRWKRCVAATDRALGEALGQVYVKTAFPPEAKARMVTMVNNLADALGSDIRGLEWMSDKTKQQAEAKLNAFQRKIGYPDKWRDYTAFAVDRGPYIQNVLRGRNYEQNRDVGKIGNPPDRTEWGMSPPTVNAYYNPSMNEIVFPAGILQPPYFDFKKDEAYNYGAAGSIIGHEMTHGFDDQGSKFDARGNLVNWWTPEDLKSFQKQAECIQKQFDDFKVGDVNTNGKLVSGESIADLAGLKIAYNAYKKSQEGKPRQIIDGFTPEQRFFIGYAHGWAGQGTPEAERLQATLDPHPLDRFRANAPLTNMPEFASAFGCKADDPMVRAADKRCEVW
ncbi:MAG: M13 family metallopeptidase [Thermoanaerobaculia bacterium]